MGTNELTEDADGVFTFRLYEAERCRSIIQYLKSFDSWVPAKVVVRDGGGMTVDVTMPTARTARLLHPDGGSVLYPEFNDKLDTIVKPLIKDLWRVDLKDHHGTQIIRYGVGGHHGPHADAWPLLTERYFTVVCYLNDDFEGGRTWFPSLGYRATPERGKAILFPARYVHCAEPVVAGEKYVCVAWIIGRPPVKWI
jgi:hypothetical protein